MLLQLHINTLNPCCACAADTDALSASQPLLSPTKLNASTTVDFLRQPLHRHWEATACSAHPPVRIHSRSFISGAPKAKDNSSAASK